MTARRKLFAGIDKLDEAENDVALARAQLSGTVEEIQSRLAPSQLLDDAISGVKTRSADLAETASDVVRDRPGTVAASAAGVRVAARPQADRPPRPQDLPPNMTKPRQQSPVEAR